MTEATKYQREADKIALDKVINGEGPFRINRDRQFATCISRNGWTVLDLLEGSLRNESTIQAIVDTLNKNIRGNNETI